MRAVGVVEFGGPEALQIVELPEPHAGPGKVRIRVHAAAVNPTDTLLRAGARAELMRRDPPPYVPGMEAAGVLDEIGEGTASDLRLGDQVMAIVVPRASTGAYAEQVVVPAESVVRMPAGTTYAQACTIPMNGLTAQMTIDMLALEPGQTLAVTGAAGAYGGYVVQLGKAAGLRVVADAAEKDEALVRQLGADVVVRRGDDVAQRIREVVPGGVDGLADGSIQRELLFGAVRDGGGFASVRQFDPTIGRGITHHMVWVREYSRERAKLDGLRQLVEEGKLTPRVARTFRPEDAPEAHRILEAGGTRGRLVIEL